MERIYESLIEDHLQEYDQMVFLAGARQVGKTTIAVRSKSLSKYNKSLNWDKIDDRSLILSGESIFKELPPELMAKTKPIIMFDEIHKYSKWKTFLKGIIDEYKGKAHIIVTGSCKLDVYRKGGDSLMGRYFLYNVHPLSVAELLKTEVPKNDVSMPKEIREEALDILLKFGGFPEPFLKQSDRFSNRWQKLRRQQMIREDIRDLSQIQEIDQLEMLSFVLQEQAGQMLNYSSLSKKIRVSDQTIRRWITVLSSYYHCFTIKPWHRNVTRSLIKDPKIYLWDWSTIKDKGSKNENFIASHLLKTVNFWNDTGMGEYGLYFLRDKEKREVDFLVS